MVGIPLIENKKVPKTQSSEVSKFRSFKDSKIQKTFMFVDRF